VDDAAASYIEARGIHPSVVPLWMTDVPATVQLVADAMDAAGAVTER
jgi:hypothetical protein